MTMENDRIVPSQFTNEGGACGTATPSETEALCVDNIDVRYGEHLALSQVSLCIKTGEIVAVLGESGSGKSTLLRAVAGLENVSRGRILWDGKDVTDVPVHLRNFGLMFQEGQLFPYRSVGGNVAYGIETKLPREQVRARVDDYLRLVGLDGYADRKISTLSGGQAQRVALARSLAPRPKLLLLDEPLSALDRSLRERLSGELRSIIKAQGTTALYVTHDHDEAFAVADKIAIISDGKLIAIDTPTHVWRDPKRRDVATFLGYGPFLDAREAGTFGVSISDGQLLALAPGALRVTDKGAEVEVASAQPKRGGVDVVVCLPGGQSAHVDSGDMATISPGQTVRVGLDRHKVAVVSP